ncbi:MAG: PHP domain-containing protein [Oscillospiraceae bacterium]|nr:PHP domain-containing protein [Oscillospiraceae bacterium]MBQ4240890.1 PHP domain-containing protein [Oscillospiraceae bacterium]
MQYRYDTHVHTSPVSRCAKATVRQTVEFYKKKGYDGIFITNHFLDGNINIDYSESYEKKIEFYFSDYEEALKIGEELGLKIFLGVELSYRGTDFLIYGLDKQWYLAHPEIMDMDKTSELRFMMEEGALVIQAHPFREAHYIDHIRLYPHCVHGIETINAERTDQCNDLGNYFADSYGFHKTAGSDNHVAGAAKRLAGMISSEPIKDEADFIRHVLADDMELFLEENDAE